MKLRLPNKLIAAIMAAASPVLFQALSTATLGAAAFTLGTSQAFANQWGLNGSYMESYYFDTDGEVAAITTADSTATTNYIRAGQGGTRVATVNTLTLTSGHSLTVADWASGQFNPLTIDKLVVEDGAGAFTVNANQTVTLKSIEGTLTSAAVNANGRVILDGELASAAMLKKFNGSGGTVQLGDGSQQIVITLGDEQYTANTIEVSDKVTLKSSWHSNQGHSALAKNIVVAAGGKLMLTGGDSLGWGNNGTASITLNGASEKTTVLEVKDKQTFSATLNLNGSSSVTKTNDAGTLELYTSGRAGAISATGTDNLIETDIWLRGDGGNTGSTVTVGTDATLTISGNIDVSRNRSYHSAGLMTKAGTGTLNLTGTNTFRKWDYSNGVFNTTDGGYINSAGTTNFYGANTMNDLTLSGGSINIGKAEGAATAGSVTVMDTYTQSAGTLTVGEGATLALKGGSLTGGTLNTGAGKTVVTGALTVGSSVNTATTDSDTAGLFIGDGGVLTLNMNGDGSQSYIKGYVTVQSGGTLVLTHDSTGYRGGNTALQKIIVETGGHLQLGMNDNNDTFAGTLVLNGTLEMKQGNSGSRMDLYGNAQVVVEDRMHGAVAAGTQLKLRKDNTVFNIGSGADLTINGSLIAGENGNNNFNKTGAGEMILESATTLTGNNNDAGATVTQGTLTFKGDTTLSKLTLNGGTAKLLGGGTLNNVVAGGGNLTLAADTIVNLNNGVLSLGSGTLTLDQSTYLHLAFNQFAEAAQGDYSFSEDDGRGHRDGYVIGTFQLATADTINLTGGEGLMRVDGEAGEQSLILTLSGREGGDYMVNWNVDYAAPEHATQGHHNAYGELTRNIILTTPYNASSGQHSTLNIKSDLLAGTTITSNAGLINLEEGVAVDASALSVVGTGTTTINSNGSTGALTVSGKQSADTTILSRVNGNANVVLTGQTTIAQNVTTTLTGTLVVNDVYTGSSNGGADLIIGEGPGQAVDISSFKRIELGEGALVRYHAQGGKTLNNITLTGDAGFYVEDSNYDRNNPAQKHIVFGGTTNIGSHTFSLTNLWKNAIDIEHLVGSGTLSLKAPTNANHEASFVNVMSLADFTGNITAQPANANYTLNIHTGDKAVSMGTISLIQPGTNYPVTLNLLGEKELTVSGLAQSSGTINIGSAQTANNVTTVTGVGHVTVNGTMAGTVNVLEGSTLTLGRDFNATSATVEGAGYVNVASKETDTKSLSLNGTDGFLTATLDLSSYMGSVTFHNVGWKVDGNVAAGATLSDAYELTVTSGNQFNVNTTVSQETLLSHMEDRGVASAELVGYGTYSLPTIVNDSDITLPQNVTLSDTEWHGTVRLTSNNTGGNATYGVWAMSAANINALVKSDSWVEFEDFKGFLGNGNEIYNANIRLTGPNALHITNGWGKEYTFNGDLAGDGTITHGYQGNKLIFKGDLSGWTGAFERGNESGSSTTTIRLEGKSTTLNAALTKTGGSALNLELGTITNGAEAYTFNRDVTINTLTTNGNAIHLGSYNDTNATMTVSSAINGLGSLTLSGEGILQMNGAINDANSLTLNGSGNMVLGAANGFTGNIVVNGGTLKAGNNRALGAFNARGAAEGTTRTITINKGGTLDVNGYVSHDNGDYAVILNGGTLTNSGAAVDWGQRQLVTKLTLEADSTVDVGSTNKFGLIASQWGETVVEMQGNTLEKVGSGTYMLTHSTIKGKGVLKVTEGALEFRNNGGNGSLQSDIVMNGGTVSVGASNGPIVLGADVAVTAAKAGSTFSATVNTAGHKLSVGGEAALTMSGVISGNGSVTKTDANAITFSAANTYTGNTTVANGALVISNSSALQNSVVNMAKEDGAAHNLLTFKSGTTTYDSATGELSGGTAIDGTVGGLTGSTGLVEAAALTINTATGADYTYSGELSVSSLHKQGAGDQTFAWNLTEAKSLTEFYAEGGTLTFVNSGTETLTFNALNQRNGEIVLSHGAFKINGGGLYALVDAGAGIGTGGVQLKHGATLDVNARNNNWRFQLNAGVLSEEDGLVHGGGVTIEGAKTSGEYQYGSSIFNVSLSDGNSMSISALDGEAEAAIRTSNKLHYTVTSDKVQISNAEVSLGGASSATTMANQLVNVAFTNTGANDMTLSNANNTLVRVHAEGGNITVQNADSSADTLKSIKATGGNILLELRSAASFSVNELVLGNTSGVAAAAETEPAAALQVTVADSDLRTNITVTGEQTEHGAIAVGIGGSDVKGVNLTVSGHVDYSAIPGNILDLNGGSLTLSTLESPSKTYLSDSLVGQLDHNIRIEVMTGIGALTVNNFSLSADDIAGLNEGDMIVVGTADSVFATAGGNSVGGSNAQVIFRADGNNTGTLLVTPEPTTTALSLLALSALATRRKRK